MVKSLTSLFIVALLLTGAVVLEWVYVSSAFGEFEEELTTLYLKVDDETANGEDAKSVQSAWEYKKDHLHIWIPHNDIARIDDYLSEAVQLIAQKNYSFALAKLQTVLHLCKCLPDTYRPYLENVF